MGQKAKDFWFDFADNIQKICTDGNYLEMSTESWLLDVESTLGITQYSAKHLMNQRDLIILNPSNSRQAAELQYSMWLAFLYTIKCTLENLENLSARAPTPTMEYLISGRYEDAELFKRIFEKRALQLMKSHFTDSLTNPKPSRSVRESSEKAYKHMIGLRSDVMLSACLCDYLDWKHAVTHALFLSRLHG